MPTKFNMSDLQFTCDVATTKDLEDYKNGIVNKELVFLNGKAGKKPIKELAEMEALDQIISGDFGYSVFCRFFEPADLERLLVIEDAAVTCIPDDIEFKSLIKNDKIFVKLQATDNAFKAVFNPPITPNALDKSPLHAGSLLDVHYQPNVWINLKNKTAGVFLKISNITVDGGKKRIRKR